MSINIQIVVGNLGFDPKVETTTKGKKKTVFSVATEDAYTDASGELRKVTEWHEIEAWGKLGEICATNLNKGRLVFVQGSKHTDRWENKNGERRSRCYLKASTVQFLDKRKG